MNALLLADGFMSELGHLLTAAASLTGTVFAIYKYFDERKSKESAQRDLTAEKATSSGSRVSFDDLKRQLEDVQRRQYWDRGTYPKNWQIWESSGGPIPVYVTRWGSQNCRVLLPNGSNVSVPIKELKAIHPDGDPPTGGDTTPPD